jgi:flagellar biosynthesis/type III secretory pathway protein FliH
MGANVSIMVDSSAPSGTVKVETPKGITDMGINTQFDNIRDILANTKSD